MHEENLVIRLIEDKSIVWFETKNEYAVLESRAANIINEIHQKKLDREIAENLASELDVPYEKAIDFVIELKEEIYLPKYNNTTSLEVDYKDVSKPSTWRFLKYYRIGKNCFEIRFENEELLSLVHPKFAHLESEEVQKSNGLFEVFDSHGFIFLFVDGKFIGDWSRKDRHYFQGKFSMELIQKIHHKEEKEWIGIFHASAVAKNDKCILFLGDSGNGKSTSLALLQAHGFDCMADDFVPFAMEDLNVYSFPSAISIKQNSLPTLLPFYPSLENAAEFHFESLNKTVRYLPPNNTDYKKQLPCNELVFIKYQEGSDIEVQKISKLDAFEKLIPDSWLSPRKENVEAFLTWFSSVTCYELTYSNNNEMIECVNKIFGNEL